MLGSRSYGIVVWGVDWKILAGATTGLTKHSLGKTTIIVLVLFRISSVNGTHLGRCWTAGSGQTSHPIFDTAWRQIQWKPSGLLTTSEKLIRSRSYGPLPCSLENKNIFYKILVLWLNKKYYCENLQVGQFNWMVTWIGFLLLGVLSTNQTSAIGQFFSFKKQFKHFRHRFRDTSRTAQWDEAKVKLSTPATTDSPKLTYSDILVDFQTKSNPNNKTWMTHQIICLADDSLIKPTIV